MCFWRTRSVDRDAHWRIAKSKDVSLTVSGACPMRGPSVLAILWRALGVFKAGSEHVSGVVDVTSLYKRNAEHTSLAVCVLSSVDRFALSVCCSLSVRRILQITVFGLITT